MELKYLVENKTYQNINQILSLEFKISTRLKNKLIRNKKITLNGNVVDTRTSINNGDKLVIDFNYSEDNSNIIPKEMPLDIIYEDDWLLVINKPSGIAVHPSILHFDNSLSNGVRFYFDKISLKKKIRPVNRLDIDTSGLVIFAKCEYIQECLSIQMKDGIFKKEYLCLVEGLFDKKEETINLPIARKKGSIIERCIDKTGKEAVTHYKVLKEFKDYSLVLCELETGRTHQIRLHMTFIKHPILGDTLYGKPSNLISRQALHSYKIKFIHPIIKKELEFVANLPEDIKGCVPNATKMYQ